MKIRYGGRAAAISLGTGVLALAWTPIAAAIALGPTGLVIAPLTIAGAVAVLGGVLMKSGRAYLTVEPGAFVIHALVGPAKRRFPFASWSDVRFSDDALTIAGERVPVHRTQANAGDWHDLGRYIAVRTVGNDAS